MKKWAQGIFKEEGTNGQKIHKEVFHFHGYKRDANKNNA
jgi:hypothetical protein